MLKRIWDAVWARVQRFWLKPDTSVAPPVAKSAPRGNKATPENREDDGQFYYLRDILDELPRIHRMLRHIKKKAPDAYGFHANFGAVLIPPQRKVSTELGDAFLEKMPTEAMVYYRPTETDDDDWVTATFSFLTKIKRPWYVQPLADECYKMQQVYIDEGKVHIRSAYFAIKGREPVPLKELMSIQNPYPMGRAWNYDYSFIDAARRYTNGDVEKILKINFITAANGGCVPLDEGALVRCKSGATTAMFGIPIKRSAYFFKDRSTETATDGRKRRIFHHVQEHERRMPDGSTVTVKEHYRGERSFVWGGSKVTITIPGLHHMKVTGINFALDETAKGERPPAGTISAAAAGKKLAAFIESGRVAR